MNSIANNAVLISYIAAIPVVVIAFMSLCSRSILRYHPRMVYELPYHRAQRDFDKYMAKSVYWEKKASSWFVPVWPLAFIMWRINNKKAAEALTLMKSRLPHHACRLVEKDERFIIRRVPKCDDNTYMKLRTILFVIALSLIWSASAFYDTTVQPETATELAVKSVNGSNDDAAAVRQFHYGNNRLPLAAGARRLGVSKQCIGDIERGVTWQHVVAS